MIQEDRKEIEEFFDRWVWKSDDRGLAATYCVKMLCEIDRLQTLLGQSFDFSQLHLRSDPWGQKYPQLREEYDKYLSIKNPDLFNKIQEMNKQYDTK